MKTISEDYLRYRPKKSPTIFAFMRLALMSPGFASVILLRLMQRLHSLRLTYLASLTRHINLNLFGADYVPGCRVGPGLMVQHPNGIVVGGRSEIGAHCTVLQQVTLGEKYADGSAPHLSPRVGDGCVIGAGSRILGKVSVGANAIIGANSVVLSDVPAGATAAGSPARILRENVGNPESAPQQIAIQ